MSQRLYVPLLWRGLRQARNLTRLRPGLWPRRLLCHLALLNISTSWVGYGRSLPK
ncbi:MAG: hypothetical protein WAS33_13325 [Candidatus Promineifilaceae bacterium]